MSVNVKMGKVFQRKSTKFVRIRAKVFQKSKKNGLKLTEIDKNLQFFAIFCRNAQKCALFCTFLEGGGADD